MATTTDRPAPVTGHMVTRFQAVWADAHQALTQWHLKRIGEPSFCMPFVGYAVPPEDMAEVEAICAATYADARQFDAEIEASKTLYLGLGAAFIILLAPVFTGAALGFLAWPPLSPLAGTMGLLIDLAGAMVLGADAMEMTRRVEITASDGAGFLAGRAVNEANRIRNLQRQRHESIKQQWDVPRKGLMLLFAGFWLQAVSQVISLGISFR